MTWRAAFTHTGPPDRRYDLFPTNSGQVITGQNSMATWTSSNSNVATLDQNGLATAVGSGSATITATVQTGGGPVAGTANLVVN